MLPDEIVVEASDKTETEKDENNRMASTLELIDKELEHEKIKRLNSVASVAKHAVLQSQVIDE